MKKLFLLCFFFLALCGCSKQKTNILPIDIVVDLYGMDKDGLSKNVPSAKLEVIRYITKIDTTYSTNTLNVSWSAHLDQDDSLSASWDIPNSFNHKIDFHKVWDSGNQKWLFQHMVIIDGKDTNAEGVIKVTLTKIKSKEAFVRQQVISVTSNDVVFDLFRVNFGMGKEEVKQNELDRLRSPTSGPGGWSETSPNNAYIYDGKTQGRLNGYEFKDGKLLYVHYVNYSSTEVNTEYMDSGE